MRTLPLVVLAALLLAGCTEGTRVPTPTQDDPAEPDAIDLGARRGLMLVDTQERAVQLLAEEQGLAWMSPNATWLVFASGTFAVARNRSANDAGQVVAQTSWARIYDDGSGLELEPERAVLQDVLTATVLRTTPIPAAPVPGTSWSTASDDLAVLGVEYPGRGQLACTHDLFINAERDERTIGCHLRVAADGRAGWTEQAGVRVRATDGTITNVTGPSSGDAAAGTFVAHENPVFTADDVVYLRLTGGDAVARTDVIGPDGDVVATLPGPARLALHDVSQDGRYLLVRAFER